jgi:ADP-heptose:LPS heptosyltransferase
MWRGELLGSQTMLIHAEPSLGHTILFLRYLELVRANVGLQANMILEIQPALEAIARQIPGVSQVVVQGDRLPGFHVHCPLLSMAHGFGTQSQNVPQNVPYIKPDAAKVEKWAEKLPDAAGRKRVGIAWADAGNTGSKRDRICPVNKLQPLAGLPGITLFNLDKTPLPAELKAVELSPDPKDLSDVAALIQHMDVVIAADTTLAHLAGAMGKKTFVLVAESPDWCWMLNRADSPWYPTAKIFRQSTTQGWGDAVAAVVGEMTVST